MRECGNFFFVFFFFSLDTESWRRNTVYGIQSDSIPLRQNNTIIQCAASWSTKEKNKKTTTTKTNRSFLARNEKNKNKFTFIFFGTATNKKKNNGNVWSRLRVFGSVLLFYFCKSQIDPKPDGKINRALESIILSRRRHRRALDRNMNVN